MSKLSSDTRRETMLGFQPPAIGDEEIAAVAETLRSGWLTTGPRAAELERRMAEYLQAEHVLALASGTAALHLALVGLGVGPGDEVITTTITWPATVNVIVHSGATPVFVDVLEGDLNIDPALVAAAVTGAGRVCGTSASSEPNVTTRSTPRSCARPSTSCENVFQRRLGSVPSRITASRPVPGISAWKNPFSGQSSFRVSPSSSETCGRVAWKS